ncbi:MAG: arginine--tRNA ligase [Syntrophobacterales bacterium]|nr:arginine--tRNA ligase [Syntrophobacterales bacterium]
MKEKLSILLEEAVKVSSEKGLLKIEETPSPGIEPTKEDAFGDYASNVAMVIASKVKMNPRKVAGIIVNHLDDRDGILEKVEVAGPGFINFFLREDVWVGLLEDVEKQGDRYGESSVGGGKRVQVEFVSANPTGPLHIGHARGAVIGDVIANTLRAVGCDVTKEYYINDVGNQMNTLGLSVYLRYRELLGEEVDFPPNYYQGKYIQDLAAQVITIQGDKFLNADEKDILSFFVPYAAGAIMDGIREDLRSFGVVFDNYFSEQELYRDDGVARLIEELQEKGFIYREGNTLWFRTTDFGDEKDRVVVRENGEPTYFAADIAYHRNKYERGFEEIIDVWGADHHGYLPRMYAAIQALGREKDTLKVVLVQLVNLLRGGKPVAMSTRSGEFVTLREVVDEVGKDAARYNFLMRRSDSHLDFDLEIAKKQSNENPVYYVQYAHARICSILKNAHERRYSVPRYGEIEPQLLKLPEEIMLIKYISRYPEVVEGSAQALEPHRFTFYLNELAAVFHSYYNKHRVVGEDAALSRARLFLVNAVGVVLRNALRILGVTAPEKM